MYKPFYLLKIIRLSLLCSYTKNDLLNVDFEKQNKKNFRYIKYTENFFCMGESLEIKLLNVKLFPFLCSYFVKNIFGRLFCCQLYTVKGFIIPTPRNLMKIIYLYIALLPPH